MWGFSTNSSTAATNTNTWGNWVVNDSTVTTGTSAATTVWQVWVDHSATGTTTSNAVYGYWVQSCQGHRFMPTHYPCPPETEEQRLQRLEDERAAAERRRVQQEEWDRKDREMRARYEAARLRAKELLLSCLDEIQRRELTEKSWFLVVSGSGKVYRIRHGVGGNIDLLGDDGKIIRSFCVHMVMDEHMPEEDHMLAQKLFLEADEDTLINKANVRSPYSAEIIDIARFRKPAPTIEAPAAAAA